MKVEIEGIEVETILMIWSVHEDAEQGSMKLCSHCSKRIGKN